jgi:hypothetical protein
MRLNHVLEYFTELVKRRLEYDVHTTEDSVRYMFFYSLLEKTDVYPYEVMLEYPHPWLAGTDNLPLEVDMYIRSTDKRDGLIVELKYDRRLPSGNHMNTPQRAGKLFNDLYRLNAFNTEDNATRLLIYLTDDEMAGYLKRRQGIGDFYKLNVGEFLVVDNSLVKDMPNQFKKAIPGELNLSVRCLWVNTSLPKQHELRVFEVQS